MPGIIGQKLGMSQIIQDDGRVIPVTFVKCSPNTVVQVKTEDKDGYPAIVLGFDAYHNASRNKKFKALKEFRVPDTAAYQKEAPVDITSLEGVAAVTVTSFSKGRGYQGVMKRHNFAGGPATHGSHFKREPGSIGTCAKPGRVHKGKKLPGHMGNQKITLRNRSVVLLAPDKQVMAIKGAIPGAMKGYVYISF